MSGPHRILTRDPVTGRELLVTRLECPESGIVIEGEFSLGWVGRLTPEQLDFVGDLLVHRCNVQKLAADRGIAYNTARSRLDAIVEALGVPSEPGESVPRGEILQALRAGEIDFERAMALLRGEDAE
jgi:hypothetical protein